MYEMASQWSERGAKRRTKRVKISLQNASLLLKKTRQQGQNDTTHKRHTLHKYSIQAVNYCIKQC